MDTNQNSFSAVSPAGQPYYSQLAPQGIFGSLLGGPVGGLIGGGIGGLLGNQTLGRQLGQTFGTIGGGFLPFNVDPVTAAYAQQGIPSQFAQPYGQQPQYTQPGQYGLPQELAPQGFFGNLLGQIGKPLGNVIGGAFGNSTLGGQIGSVAGQLGRFLPFNVDPVTAAYAQQQLTQSPQFAQGQFGQPTPFGVPPQFAQQSPFGQQTPQFAQQSPFGQQTPQFAQQSPFGQQTPQFTQQSPFGQPTSQFSQQSPFGQPTPQFTQQSPFGQQTPQFAQQSPFGQQTPPFAQQGQFGQVAQELAPQGFFGNLLGQIGKPLGTAIGGAFGNSSLGGQIGSVAGQLGRFLPFNVDPVTAAYAQQQLLTQSPPFVPGQFGQPTPFGVAPQFAQQIPFGQQTPQFAQQGQFGQLPQELAPQGFFGNLLGQYGKPLGTTIGTTFGNPALGTQLGTIASQFGRYLPFNVDPITAAYAQQQLTQQPQFAQQTPFGQPTPQFTQQGQFGQQLAPQGFFGNLLGQVGQPLGTAIGSYFGNPNLGGQIGGTAGQFARFLPFQAYPGIPLQGTLH